ncbi:MAG: nucleotidyltransferase domain-containing protein [Thermoproteota archaeon]
MRSLDAAWERASILSDWEKWSVKIKEAADEALSSDLLGVYVFGSAVTGRLVAFSDVDMLVVAKNLPESIVRRSEIKDRIIDKAGLPLIHPFEIHLVDEEEAKVYFRHINESFIKL